MDNVDTITFTEPESGEHCTVIVRASPKTVGLCISREQDGDVEVFLGTDEIKRLASAIRRAEIVCNSKPNDSAV